MSLFKEIFQKKKVEIVFGKKDQLKKLALEKIDSLEKTKFSEQNFDEFIFIFRVFMFNIFNLKKQTTHEEFVLELEKRKIDKNLKSEIINLSSSINKIEYENGKINGKELKELIARFKKIINVI